ncbi:MAG: spermidine/putrescine ABC transporter substrate-binding protein [Actinomycetota bacterium]
MAGPVTAPAGAAWSRRTFLVAVGAAGVSAACGLDPNAGSAQEYDLGGTTQLTILNWPSYIDPDGDAGPGTISRAQTDLGLQITYLDEYTDNYDGYDLVVANALNQPVPAYDIVMPTNWLAAQMIAASDVEPLPLELIPNHVNLDPQYMTNTWDRGSRFQMPWQAGITGLAYNPALTERPITSFDDLFDPALAGRVGIIGEMREAVGLAMLANGDDPSRPTEAAADAALQRVMDGVASGQIAAITFEDFAEKLETGELAAAMAWSGDAFSLLRRRPDIEFVIPDHGAIRWFDTMVIPRNSANVAAAGAFMNYVYEPANGARITASGNYISPVIGVQDELRATGFSELADDPVLFPDASTRNRLFTWGGLDLDFETTLDDRFNSML